MATALKNNHRRNGGRNKKSINAPFDIHIPSSLRDPTDTNFSSEQLQVVKNDDQARQFALGLIHNHEEFAKLWNSTTIHPNTRRLMRKIVQIQTINAIYNGYS